MLHAALRIRSYRSHFSSTLFGLMSTVLLSSQILPATASSQGVSAPMSQAELTQNQPAAQSSLPLLVRMRFLRHVSQETGVPISALTIVNSRRETWSDSCLGIPNPVALCAAVITPGWRIEVNDGEIYRVYRTNASAQVILEEIQVADVSEFPRLTASRVLEEILQSSNLPLEQLDIVGTEPRTWDGCLGLPPIDGVCTKIAISGWRVIVKAPQHVWVYHTNQDGTDIRLNAAASQLGDATLVPTLMPWNPDINEPDALFSVTQSGGFAGSTSTITLYQDGRLVQMSTGTDGPIILNRLSPAEVETFMQQLRTAQIDRFAGLQYSAPAGSADYFTVSMMLGGLGMVQYDDAIASQLPSPLQQSIQFWTDLVAKNL